MLKIGHSITRPGRRLGDADVTLDVPEELESEAGIVQTPADVDFYSREYPIESLFIGNDAEREFTWKMYTRDMVEELTTNNRLSKPVIEAAKTSGDLEPTAAPEPGGDVTQEIKARARELGFGEVGISKFDTRYVYKSKRRWVKFPHAVCLAYEQDYEPTQTIPSREAEGPHFGTYRIMSAVALELADYIRSLGYHAQVHHPLDNSSVFLPMFVEAGLGQLGANGQLLSPHFGSRARLMIVTTDAIVTYDEPVDYGIQSFCSVCQVCVNRCPGRALLRDKVWWRGVQKQKVIYKRCRPVMARYDQCGICMKVCPVQRYGMKPVMDHYVSTGHVLGKGTHLLEGYEIGGVGYFGPGELPSFDAEFFYMPHGSLEDNAFNELKDAIVAGEVPDGAEGAAYMQGFKERVATYLKGPVDFYGTATQDQDAEEA